MMIRIRACARGPRKRRGNGGSGIRQCANRSNRPGRESCSHPNRTRWLKTVSATRATRSSSPMDTRPTAAKSISTKNSRRSSNRSNRNSTTRRFRASARDRAGAAAGRDRRDVLQHFGWRRRSRADGLHHRGQCRDDGQGDDAFVESHRQS